MGILEVSQYRKILWFSLGGETVNERERERERQEKKEKRKRKKKEKRKEEKSTKLD